MSASRRRSSFAVGVALALGIAGTGTMYVVAERAQQAAEREARQRQAVLDFVTRDVLGQADAYRNAHADAQMSLMEAIERSAAVIDDRLQEPAAAAAVHAMVAAVFFTRDRHADAVKHYDRAHELYASLDDPPQEALVAVETGLCDVHRIAGDLGRAQQVCMAASVRAAATGTGRDLATLKLGQLRGEQGLDEESLAQLRPLLAADAFADDPRLRAELHWAMGLAERGLGRYAAARRHFETLLALQPGDGIPSTWTAWAYNSLGSVQASLGEYDAAEATLLEARRIFGATQGTGQVEAQMPNIWRGEMRLRRGQWAEAAALQQGLLDAWRSALAADHALWLKAEANLAWARAETGEPADREAAQAALDAALRERASVFERPGDEVAVRAMRWTRVALALGADAQADDLLAIVDAALVREFPEAHPVRAEAECLHARRALDQGRRSWARRRATACVDMHADFFDPAHPLVLEARALLGAAGPAPAAGVAARAGD